MKCRTGFVSNSSSSSYVCEICGRTGYDYNDEIEFVGGGFALCEAGHTICMEHLGMSINELAEKYIGELVLGTRSDADVYEELAAGLVMSALARARDRIYSHGFPESLCPICLGIEPAGADRLLEYALCVLEMTREDLAREELRQRKSINEG